MSNVKITDITKDLPILNEQLERINAIENLVKSHDFFLTQINHTLQKQIHQQDAAGSNSLMLTWAGSTGKFSWPAGFIRDITGVYHPIPAGTSVALSPSTYYWVAWNPSQQSMSFQTSLATLQNIPQSLIAFQVFTGTAGQSGSAGGGGTDPGGTGYLGRAYKNF